MAVSRPQFFTVFMWWHWLLAMWGFPFSIERFLLNHAKTPGFLAPGGEEFNPGSVTRLDHSELLCNKVLSKYKGDRESFWHRHQKGVERVLRIDAFEL